MRACQILVSVRFSSSRKLPRADSLRPVKPTLLMAWLLEGGGCGRRRRRHAIGDTNKSTLDGLRTHRRGGCAGGEFPLKLLLRNKSHQNYYVCIIFERDRQTESSPQSHCRRNTPKATDHCVLANPKWGCLMCSAEEISLTYHNN